MGLFVRLTVSPVVGIGLIVYETVWGQRSATVYMVGLSLIGIPPFLGETGAKALTDAIGRVRRNGNGNGNGDGKNRLLLARRNEAWT